ncbi:MAG: hypothetical protein ACE5FH_08750 [Candidatus Zixiibacteriota bacterium]
MTDTSWSLREWWPILPALAFYTVLCYVVNYTQDDAFISYRYVANFLDGNGLVYNIGQRIEGITNFGWVVLLIAFGSFGLDYVLVSKMIGFLFGGGFVVVTFLTARLVLRGTSRLWVWIPTYLVACNLSLAYWSPAGLETGAFVCMAGLSLYLMLCRNWLLVATLAFAVWLRPEGALLAGVLIVCEFAAFRTFPRFSLLCGVVAFVASLPMVGFKLLYYGSLLPNPFYAKTGLDWQQITNGLEYAGRFFVDYSFIGLGWVIPIVLFRRLSPSARAVTCFAVSYTLYVIAVGGDVLEVHRFLLPLLGCSGILLSLTLGWMASRWQSRSVRYTLAVAAAASVLLTVLVPREYVFAYHHAGIGLNRKMRFLADQLKQNDSRSFSVALTTIGVFGYELIGHDIIDMVGLTDTVISRHPQPPIKGITSQWRERKYNTPYLLSRAPDYILFSTGLKPTAPGEKALLLYRQFLYAYRTIGFSYRVDTTKTAGVLTSIYKRMRPIVGWPEPTYPAKYVDYFQQGINAYLVHDQARAIRLYDSALAVSPQPYNPYVRYRKGLSYFLDQKHNEAMNEFNSLVQDDSLVFEAHKELYLYARLMNDPQKASVHERWLKKLVPWYWPRLKKLTDLQVKETQRMNRKASRP